MLKDIEGKDDLVLLVDAFYTEVRADEILGPIFNTIIADNWSKHLSIMYGFWNSVLFGVAGYKGQAVGKHIEIDRKISLEARHFERWIGLWNTIVDAHFVGKNAEAIKSKALLTLKLIRFKVDAARGGKLLF